MIRVDKWLLCLLVAGGLLAALAWTSPPRPHLWTCRFPYNPGALFPDCEQWYDAEKTVIIEADSLSKAERKAAQHFDCPAHCIHCFR